MTGAALLSRIAALDVFPANGRVQRISSGEIEANGPDAPVGAHCEIVSARDGSVLLRALAVSISAQAIDLVPFGKVDHVRIGDHVRLVEGGIGNWAGDALSGRAIDALGHPLDGGPLPWLEKILPQPRGVLDRVSPSEPLVTGIRAIDGLLTLGKGQRVGIFAASGVGKTRLIEQIVRQAECDRIVICQIGERGREVASLWSDIKASGKLAKSSLVAATSDESAPMRSLALEQALSMAEFWRDKGEDVLLVVDSMTRYAMALREIGLAADEPPMLRAYTPNVLRELPRIVERCGAVRGGGSITALFTVLSETDDVDDPIVEVMKALLDGHIILSRRLAEAAHFPAVDVNRSISRLFDKLAGEQHIASARSIRALLSKFEESRILIESGMYKSGSDRELDRSIAARSAILEFLKQPSNSVEAWPTMLDRLDRLAGGHV